PSSSHDKTSGVPADSAGAGVSSKSSVGSATARFSDHMSGRDAADPYAPGLGAFFEILPGELAGMFGLELVIQWLGIVIVDQYERGAVVQTVVGLEDQFVPARRDFFTDIEHDVVSHRGLLGVCQFLVWHGRAVARDSAWCR